MIPVPENSFGEFSKSVAIEELGLPEMFIDKLIAKFLETIDNDMATLKNAIENKDSEAIRQAGHKIKGSAANLRFKYLAEIMKTIEYAGKDGVVDGFEDLISTAKQEIEKIKSGV